MLWGIPMEGNRASENALRKKPNKRKSSTIPTWIDVVLKNIGDAIIVTDSKKCLAFLNPAAENLTGWRLKEAVGKPLKQLGRIVDWKRIPIKNARHQRIGTVFTFRGATKTGVDTIDAGFNVDSTERKRVEEALRESEARFRDMIENTSDWIWELDARMQYSYASSRIQDLLGYSPEEVEGKTPLDLMPAEKRAHLRTYLTDLMEKPRPIRNVENINLHKDGSLRVLETSGVPIFDKKGRFTGYRGIDRDITEHIRADEALKESELKYRQLFELESDAIVMIENETGRILEANDTASVLYGYSHEELHALKNTDLSAEPNETRRMTQSGGMLVPIRWHKKKDETVFPVEITGRHFLWQGKKVHIAAIRDITKRLEAEQVLRKSEEKYRAIFNNIQDVYYEAGLDGVLLEISPSIGQVTHLRKADLIGKPLNDFLDEPPGREKLLDTILRTGRVSDHEILLKDGKGAPVPCSVVSTLVYDDLHRPVKVVGSIRDISERKKSEERILASLREQDILFKEIHHRVKNNMQVMISLLRLQMNHVQDPTVQTMLKESQGRIRSMALVHEKLYQSQNLAKIDLGDYIRTLADSLYHSYGVSSGSIELQVNVGSVFIGLDKAIPCGLVLHELISNTLKHAFPVWTGRRAAMEIALSQEGEKTTVVFMDNGIGFPKEIDFRQAQSLGLKLVIMLIEEQLQGTVVLDTQNGTRFTIAF